MPAKLTTKEFINKAILKHGDVYDYSLVKYEGTFIPVEIICKTHGLFKQRPNDHLSKSMCPGCGIVIHTKNYKKTIIGKRFKDVVQPDDYKIIVLPSKDVCIVDNDDFEKVKNIPWYLDKSKYVRSESFGLIHRFIMNCPKNKVVDHINHNPLDNRKQNLRICNNSENILNCRPNRKSTSIYKGVSYDNSRNKWKASIGLNRRTIFIGRYDDEIQAAKAYDNKAKELFKEFAYLNFKN